MARTQITDMCNKLLAILDENENTITLLDPMGRALGKYDKTTNTTTDMMNKALAKGNILTTLIR